MEKYFSIGVMPALMIAVIGCSGGTVPLEGQWQGEIKISGLMSDLQIPTPESKPLEIDEQAVVKIKCQFLPGGEIVFEIEPISQNSGALASQETLPYQMVEQLPDQIIIEVTSPESQPRKLQFRLTGPNSLTLTELNGNPRVLPIEMTKADSNPTK